MKISKVREGAKIPKKREEDAGYDIYACFDEDYVVIGSHECKFIPTGIATVFSKDYVALLRERGSTGSKQMALRCGVIDSNFRGEWKVALDNTSSKTIVICKEGVVLDLNIEYVRYPYEKAIAQFIMTNAHHLEIEEITRKEFDKIDSNRGVGMLGSTGA